MTKVNPEILRWARETAGFSIEEACQKLGINNARGEIAAVRLTALENGETEPTRPMLLKMASQYHRPLLVFYLNVPPRRGNRGQDFRVLPRDYSLKSDALVDALLRDVQARQRIIRSGLEDEEEPISLPFVHSMKVTDGEDIILDSIRKTIKFDLHDFRKQTSLQDAFSALRSHVEKAGIFVLLIGDLGSYHTDIALESFRGFALADEIAPFIVINDQDSKAAWSFTLIHELVHIWLGQTGISNIESGNEIEQFCNRIASEFFLSKDELKQLIPYIRLAPEELLEKISDFAEIRNVSGSMVAYNLFLVGMINKKIWQVINDDYKALWYEKKQKQQSEAHARGGGPNYYVVHRSRVGASLITIVQRMIAGGILTTTKASKILGVKPKNVQKLLELNSQFNVGRIL